VISSVSQRLQYSWNTIFRVALNHKKQLISAHLVAIFAAIISVPIPLLMPLLVDEVLLDHPGIIIETVNRIAPIEWQQPIVYIGIILVLSLVLRLIAIFFNIIQGRQFSYIAKDIIFKIRKNLIQRLQHISMSEYESLGTGTVITHMVTDLDTLDQFIGTTVSKLLIASLTVLGTAIILLWMHWQLGLFILCLNPIVIYFTRSVGSHVKELKIKENSAYGIFQQSLAETLDAIHQIRASNREQHYCQQLIDCAENVKINARHFAWKSDAVSRLSFLIFLFGIDIFRATAMLLVLYSDLTIGETLAVFSYLWHMMAPIQEMLNIQYSFYGAKAALARINQFNNLQQEPNYPTLKNPFINTKTVSVTIKDLHFSYHERSILKGINLEIKPGEIHAIMGPNGSGKSTLSSVISGNETYKVTQGDVILDNESLLDFPPEERAHKGIFMSFQYPVEIPGVTTTNFIKTAINAKRKALGLEDLPANEMLKKIRDTAKLLDIDRKFLSRSLNEGFSGGEKKRNEIFQMAMLEPKLAILDETDSGLDIDALKIVANGVNKLKSKDNAVILITHYQRLLDYIVPDFVHVLYNGKIVKSGGKELAYELEEKGYDWLK